MVGEATLISMQSDGSRSQRQGCSNVGGAGSSSSSAEAAGSGIEYLVTGVR